MNITRISTADLIGILFLYLKLTGEINWSWWWVTAPFWVGITITIIVEKFKEKRERKKLQSKLNSLSEDFEKSKQQMKEAREDLRKSYAELKKLNQTN